VKRRKEKLHRGRTDAILALTPSGLAIIYKMTAKYFLTGLLLLTFFSGYTQSKTDTSNIVYEPIQKGYLKEYNKASFIADYFFSDGWSNSDRYSYEIILTDSLLTLNFNSPGSDSYKHVVYHKKKILTHGELNDLKKIIRSAQLKQTKKGIPRATFSAYTKEVLIVRYRNISIAGGLAYGNIASYPGSESEIQVKKEIADDRRQSSSIGGNYDLLISALKKYFTALAKLKKRSLQE
jgi:hypothetical protein